MTKLSNNPTELNELKALWQAREQSNSAWLNQLQKHAFDIFSSSGFPTTRMEDWKYTDTRNIATNYPQWLKTQPQTIAHTPALLDIDNSIHLAFIDGHYSPKYSGTKQLPPGIIAGNLGDLADCYPGLLQEKLGKLANNNDSGFVAINTAFACDGAALLLPDNQDLEQPIYLSFFSSTPEITIQPRLLINLGVNSRATVLEHYSSNVAAITNAVTEINCGKGSELTWYKLQDEHIDAWHTAVQYAHLDQDATIKTTQIDIGAGLARNELRLTLAGRGAHAEAKGLLMADAQRHVDSRITVEHTAPETSSRERYRSILADCARGVFNGRILVQAEAQKTAAELTNKNLLLNSGAEINTKPELEIYADDVKCAHGSTTGQLDETSMFYLISRGLNIDEARNILIRAFAGELLTDISIEALRNRVQSALEELEHGHVK
ncbi:MAG: Fe-S cluster assembly protein SufD [Gammaproteobacteria bacterium]|nr:Fe-S cluster assembly protein SufD [Gammaproteobacteria bacterium]MCP4277322.1 Fe-S cluster assembly protein SufD [Gammaproteobacteria bacterium]